jgi:GDPmannose 4,6-dehydratase
MKRALIVGINGMDGSYLAEHLLQLGYEVHGTTRFSSSHKNIESIKNKLYLHFGEITDPNFIYKTIFESNPDEIYHLAAISNSAEIWNDPLSTYNVDGISIVLFLEAIKSINKNIKFLFCSSSEIYANNDGPIDENTPFNPASPYGIAKLFAHQNIKMYTKKYGIYACNAICFNHESERRGDDFVTKKISKGVAEIYLKSEKEISFGNIKVKKDWGYAPEYVVAMNKMLQLENPEDFILASGSLYSVEEIIKHAFEYKNISDWQKYVNYDMNINANRVNKELVGIIDKAKSLLNWEPKTTILQAIECMVEYEIKNNMRKNNIILVS